MTGMTGPDDCSSQARLRLDEWADSDSTCHAPHSVHTHALRDEHRQSAAEIISTLVPSHYVAPDRLAKILDRNGRPAAARALRDRLPTWTTSRSGDFGEILGAEYVRDHLKFTIVNRLRWKDSREMAMRGEDLLAVRLAEDGTPTFLKGEVKSRAHLGRSVVKKASKALASDHGLPSAHSLQFFADRLGDAGLDELQDVVDEACLLRQLSAEHVTHLLLTVSGNSPTQLLTDALDGIAEAPLRYAVGIVVSDHGRFIKGVFEKAYADAE